MRGDELLREIDAACRRLVGGPAERVYAPGGSVRDSLRVEVGAERYVFTRRKSASRARLEAACLTGLYEAGAPVPRLIAFDGEWAVQEHVPGTRLNIALHTASDADRPRLIRDAVRSLFDIGAAGTRAGLERIAPKLGSSADWLQRVIERPDRLAARIGIAPPVWDRDAALTWLHVPCERFVKWDARPGNAIVRDDGAICWFDWEHAGCRSGLEDFAWLGADEFFPGPVDIVADEVVARLSGPAPPDEVSERLVYLGIFATLHAAFRLGLIVDKLAEHGWRKPADVLRRDSIGATPLHLGQLIANARGWARRSDLTAPLDAWYAAADAAIRRD